MSDNKPPSPEEIHKEFEDFVRKRFGDRVQIFTQQVNQPPPGADIGKNTKDVKSGKDGPARFNLLFDYKPRDIKSYLDRFIIKQDEAKKALSIAVCDHYNHVRQRLEHPENENQEYSKQNVLLMGPTGVGKTYLIRQIAKLIGVPFVKADATKFSETGYVGANVDDLIHDLVAQAGGDIELAQYGIVYLDEADKLASPRQIVGRDVSGRGVQFGLLKLMEETDVDLRAGNDVKSQMQAFMDFQRKGKVESKVINTRHILFIISGAFTSLTDIVKARLEHNSIGFSVKDKTLAEGDAILDFANTQDFIDYGFEPEFVGRLPIRVACHHLEAEDLLDILQNSEGSILRQYERAFKAYGIDATFTDEALRKIAELAHEEKTGARALMTVAERILRDFKFFLPSLSVPRFEVNADVVNHPKEQLEKILINPEYTLDRSLKDKILQFEQYFFSKYAMRLSFTTAAMELLCRMAQEQNQSPEKICEERLFGYEHGLKLIQQNTGQSQFVIDEEVIINPQVCLEKWIRNSYSSRQIIKPNENDVTAADVADS